MRSREEMRGLIEKNLERVDRYLDIDTDALEPSQRVNVARAVFNKGHTIATYAAVLGDRERATTWFERAARYRLIQAQTALEHPDAVDRTQVQLVGQFSTEALLSGVLSCSRAVQEATAAPILGFDDSTRDMVAEREGEPMTIDESQLLAAVILDRREKVKGYVGSMEDALPTLDDHFSSLPPGQSRPFTEACNATIDRDLADVSESINRMLDAHRTWVGDEPRGRKEVVDHPSTAICLLAGHYDLDISVESQFIPSCLL